MEKQKSVVLVVEDQKVNRQILKRILSLEYDVIEAENGQEALQILNQNPRISAVLLDIMMPVMDGYTFLESLNKKDISYLPVIVITSEKDSQAEQKALDLGAWDFVSKPYQPKTLLTRLKNVIVRSQFYYVSEMKHAYEHDALTGLYNRTGFLQETRHMLDELSSQRFVLIRFDIDDFHIYNAFWGEEEGDKLLHFIAGLLNEYGKMECNCTYGRISADVFCICMPYEEQKVEKLMYEIQNQLGEYKKDYQIKPTFGIYVIEDNKEKVHSIYEQATLAARESKRQYMSLYLYYTPEMSQKVIQEQSIVNDMQYALDHKQFVVYLQPKYNLKTEKPYGAEALIRWNMPGKGMLSPGLFIPVFERNGFIGKVDFYMWDSVCQLLKKWIDQGKNPAPISVNVSRINMYNPNLVEIFKNLVKKYNVPAELLNLELTESAYMENPEIMGKVVLQLQEAGFSILMDDFGSGYSSLNTLKDIPVDVLKIDMKFLSGDSSTERSECILASIIRMAGWLDTPVIMEGVETREQVTFLKSIGCGYVQGYFYARPMPVSDYEALLEKESQAELKSVSENLEQIKDVIWNSSAQLDLLFNSFQIAAGIYEYEDHNFRALRVNSYFDRYFGYGEAVDNQRQVSYKEKLSPQDLNCVLDCFETTAKTRQDSSCSYKMKTDEGTEKNILMKLQYWGSNENMQIIFATYEEK